MARTVENWLALRLVSGLLILTSGAAAQPEEVEPIPPSNPVSTPAQAAVSAGNQGTVAAEKSKADATDAFAQRHWHSGMAYLEEGDYAKALEAFTKAYELSERPSLLRSIAVAHEKLGDLPSAMAAIDLYLRQVPDAADINDILAYRGGLQNRYDKEQATLVEETPASATDPSTHRSQPAATDHYVLPEPDLDHAVGADEASNTRDIVLWSAVGVAVASGAGAVFTGIRAQAAHDRLGSACVPPCTRKDTHEGRTLAFASTVLTGVAALATGTAVWVWLTDDSTTDRPEARRASVAPQFDADYADGRFMSRAQWRF